jgi:hypothetical protein
VLSLRFLAITGFLLASQAFASVSCAELLSKFYSPFQGRISRILNYGDLGWKEALQQIRQGRPFGRMSLTPLEVDTLEKLLKSFEATGGQTQNFFEGLHGLASKGTRDATSLVQHMDQLQLLIEAGQVQDQKLLIMALSRLKVIDARISPMDLMRDWTQALLGSKDQNARQVLAEKLLQLSKSNSKLERELKRLGGGLKGAENFLDSAATPQAFAQWKPFMDATESFSESMARHSRFRKSNTAFIHAARIIGLPFNVPGEAILLAARYGFKKNPTLMGLAGVIAADIAWMYLVVDPALDWVRESYTPNGKLQKEIDHALDQATHLQISDLYRFRDHHVNKKELDPRFRPTPEEQISETPTDLEASRAKRVDEIQRFYKHYNFEKTLLRQDPAQLMEKRVIQRWVQTFTPSPEDPLDQPTQNAIAQSTEAFLLSLHQLDSELTRYFNSRIQNSKDNPFRNTLTLEPFTSEVVARNMKRLVDSFESGELGVGADSTLRVGLQQILEQAYIVDASQLVLTNHFGEARPSRSDLEALLEEQMARKVWGPLTNPLREPQKESQGESFTSPQSRPQDALLPTESTHPAPNQRK